MAQWLRVLAALTQDPGSIPGTHIVTPQFQRIQPTPFSGLLRDCTHVIHIHTHAVETPSDLFYGAGVGWGVF